MVTGSRNKTAPAKKTSRKPESGRAPDSSRAHGSPVQSLPSSAAAKAAPAPIVRPPTEEQQREAYERAIGHFHQHDFQSAQRMFQVAGAGPSPAMAHSARVFEQMCARRLAGSELHLRNPEERYDYAITLVNKGRLEQAERLLIEAAAENPRGDHIYYALALCRGLRGDMHGAYVNLKRAIDLNPKENRTRLRNDPDFAAMVQIPPLSDLL